MEITPKFYSIPKSLLAAVVLLVTIALAASVAESTGVPTPRVLDTYGKLPVSFEVNEGQTDAEVKFLSRGNGYTLFLTSTEAVMVLRMSAPPSVLNNRDASFTIETPGPTDSSSTAQTPVVLRMKLVDANPSPKVTGLHELPGKANYFLGNDPQKWRSNVPTYAKVTYQE